MSINHRTIRRVTLVIESKDKTREEHDRLVFQAENSLLNANRHNGPGVFTAVVITSDDSTTRFSGAGSPTEETKDIIEDLQAS